MQYHDMKTRILTVSRQFLIHTTYCSTIEQGVISYVFIISLTQLQFAAPSVFSAMILISFLSSHETGLVACYFENIFGHKVYIPQIFEACARCCH